MLKSIVSLGVSALGVALLLSWPFTWRAGDARRESNQVPTRARSSSSA